MTYRCTTVLFLCILLSGITHAQGLPLNQHPVQKPYLFSSLPDKFSCSLSFLDDAFAAEPGKTVVLTTGKEMRLNGVQIEKVQVSEKQLSINFRCTNFQNALLNLSKISRPGGGFRYTGRIVSPIHGDILVLLEENGHYYFVRKTQLHTMVE